MWFQLRPPDLAEDFEHLLAGDRDIVRGSLDTVSEWRLTRPTDVPGQAIGDRNAARNEAISSRRESETTGGAAAPGRPGSSDARAR
jgi:hypothetical protein